MLAGYNNALSVGKSCRYVSLCREASSCKSLKSSDLHLSGHTPSSGQCLHLQASVQELPAQFLMAVAVFIGSLGSLPGWRFQFIYSNTVIKSRTAAHQAQGHLQCCHSRRSILAGPAPGHVPGSICMASVRDVLHGAQLCLCSHLSEPLLTKPWLICPMCHVGFLAERTSDGSFYLSLENWSGFLFLCLLSKRPGCCVLICLLTLS